MKILLAAVVIALLAGPTYAQTQQPVPKAGEDLGKTEKQIRDEKEADQAYQKSLGNIPTQKATDPWGTVRSDNKAVAKEPAAKRGKAGGTPN
jgi:hypothetical protein